MKNNEQLSENRPVSLDQYVARQEVKNSIKYAVIHAKKQNTSFPHTLIVGGGGTGKTTLGYIIGNEMGVKIRYVPCQGIKSKKDISNAFVRNKDGALEDGDVVIFDEVHLLKKGGLQEMLYNAMEDYMITVPVENREINYRIKKIVVVLITNEPDKLTDPLIDRCKLRIDLDRYTDESISDIIKINAGIRGISISDDAAMMISGISRGIPRIGINNLEAMWRYADAIDEEVLNADVVRSGLREAGVDEYGLSDTDKRVLHILYEMNKVSLESLASMIGTRSDIVEKEIEPYLMIKGLLIRTGGGRMITEKGWTMVADGVI